MSTPFLCGSDTRRQLVREAPSVNGIDYLEVVDHEALSPALRQRTLLVHALKPIADLSGAHLRLLGGVRIMGIQVSWSYPASGVPSDVAPDAERAWYGALPDADRILVLRTDQAGDFSSYALELSSAPDSFQPLEGWDPRLSQVTFSFKVECPSDFDCQTPAPGGAATEPEPLIDYLAKDYRGFRRLMLDRLATTLPDWQERNPLDLGVTLVELLAYAADQTSYYQDAVATEAYLGTARRRVSVRRHARLLDYDVHEGCNSRVFVTLEVDQDGLLFGPEEGATRPRFLTRVVAPTMLNLSEAALDGLVDKQDPVLFEPMHRLALYQAHNQMTFYTWGEVECALPKGATSATLLDDPVSRLRLRAGDVLILEEVISPTTGLPWDADAGRRHAVRLIRVSPEALPEYPGSDTRVPGPAEVDPVTSSPYVTVEWADEDALPFPLTISTRIGGELVTDVTVIRGNVVLADQGRTIEAEELPQVPLSEPYRPRLGRAGLIYRVPFDPRLLQTNPVTGVVQTQAAARLLRQDPRAALPAIALNDGHQPWASRPHLLQSDRFATEFVVETEEDGTGLLRFGDGLLGRRPEPGGGFQATYRTRGAAARDVGAEAIGHLVTSLSGIRRVRNPLPASGSMGPESLEQVRQNAPVAFRRQERAVSAADYAAVAARHPEVQQAAASFRWTGSWYTVYVTVDRIGGRSVDPAFQAEMLGFLTRFRMAGLDLEIEPPQYVPLEIVLDVCAAPGHYRSAVRQALLQAFTSGYQATGERGFFHPDNFSFGQTLYLSQVVAVALQVPGVLSVTAAPTSPTARFQRWGHAPQGELTAGQIQFGRLEIPQLANDPNRPENGKIEFNVRGGL